MRSLGPEPLECARQFVAQLAVIALDPALAANHHMTRPLAIPGIDAAVVEAVRISRTGDEMRLTTASRQCHSTFRLKPELEQFDRCAAFDDAVVRLQDRDPLRDRGAFSQIAVSGRLWSAAAYLSGDYLATDSRLQRIRIRVETLLSGDGRIIGGAS